MARYGVQNNALQNKPLERSGVKYLLTKLS
jgi:hypothetical protein